MARRHKYYSHGSQLNTVLGLFESIFEAIWKGLKWMYKKIKK